MLFFCLDIENLMENHTAMRTYTGPPRSELERFMRLVGADTYSLIDLGISQPTLWKVSTGWNGPSLKTYQTIVNWAEKEARKRKLSRRLWLRWKP